MARQKSKNLAQKELAFDRKSSVTESPERMRSGIKPRRAE
jgi:hypothetical protein